MILYFLFQRCLLWSEVSLNEALTRYQNASVSDVKEDWFRTLKLLFSGLNTWASCLICYYHLCMSVILAEGVAFDHYPWCIEPHYTKTPPRHVQTCSTWTTLCRDPPTCTGTQPLSPLYRTPAPPSLASAIWWPGLFQSCSLEYWHLVTGQRKRTVRILLGCFLVLIVIRNWTSFYPCLM